MTGNKAATQKIQQAISIMQELCNSTLRRLLPDKPSAAIATPSRAALSFRAETSSGSERKEKERSSL
eukprot:1146767-Pelagomonas_calceolata.AAC.3